MMEPTECMTQSLQSTGPMVYSMMHNNHQSHQVPTTSTYSMMQTTSDPYHIMNQVPLGIPMEQHIQPIQMNPNIYNTNEPLQPIEMNPNAQNVNELLEQLSAIPDKEDITESQAQEKKEALNNHRLFPALRSVLCDMKMNFLDNPYKRMPPMEEELDNKPNEQLKRLDNMLMAEGIAEPNSHSEDTTNTAIAHLEGHGIENPDYSSKLKRIKKFYREELGKYEMSSNLFKNHVRTLLAEQCVTRPISLQEADKVVDRIERRFKNVQIQLKEQTCENVMILRSRYLDARRKRRNFSKEASDILNAYFYSHLHNPYPSESTKERLAKQCDITVAQVSNWFGNKRIRYKKNISKAEEEANIYANKKSAITMQHEPPSVQPLPPMAVTPVFTYNDISGNVSPNVHQPYGQFPHLCSNTPVMGYNDHFNNRQPSL